MPPRKQHPVVEWLSTHVRLTVSALAIVVTLGSAVTFADELWYRFGWMSPQTIDEVIVGEITDFREEWKCDEYMEELVDLLERQQAGDSSVETELRIQTLQLRMGPRPDGIDCQRFED